MKITRKMLKSVKIAHDLDSEFVTDGPKGHGDRNCLLILAFLR